MATQRNGKWRGSIQPPDAPRVRYTFDTQAEAEAWEEKAREAVADGRPIPTPRHEGAELRPKGGRLTTLGPLFDHVCRTHWAGTRGEYERKKSARLVVEYFGRNKPVSEITSVEVAEMRAEMAATGLSTASVNRRCSALSKLLHTAKDAGVIQGVPNLHMKREERTKFRYLDRNEEKLLLAYWRNSQSPEYGDLCIFLLDTGARIFSEAVALKWEDIGHEDRSVTFWITKTGKPRTLPLTERCREVIARRRVVAGDKAGPFAGLNKDSLYHRWADMRRILGFTDVTPHTLRHTCCTRLVLGGADVKRVMTWMGHTAIQTTMRYMQVRTTDLDSLLEMLG